MFKSLIIEGFSDGPNTTIHHVAWTNEIRTSSCLNDRLLTKLFNRLIIENNSLFTHNPVVPITGIGVQSNIRHDRHLRNSRFDLTNRTGN